MALINLWHRNFSLQTNVEPSIGTLQATVTVVSHRPLSSIDPLMFTSIDLYCVCMQVMKHRNICRQN